MCENILSIAAIVISIVSIYATFQQNQRALKIQLFELRIHPFHLLQALVASINEHASIINEEQGFYLYGSDFILEMLANNTGLKEIYNYLKTDGYENYNSRAYLEMHKIQQTAFSFPLVFKDDNYSQRAMSFVNAYIETLKALYEHHVFVKKIETAKDELPKLLAQSEQYQKQTEANCKKDLEDRKVIKLVATLLDEYRELMEIASLDELKKQVTLSKP